MLPHFEGPAKVIVTLSAEGEAPDISGKPGEVRSSPTGSMTTGSGAEAAHLENYT